MVLDMGVVTMMNYKPVVWPDVGRSSASEPVGAASVQAPTRSTVTPGAYGEGMDEGDITQMAHDSIPPEMFDDPERDWQDEQAEREWFG